MLAVIAVTILSACGKTIGISETALPKSDWPVIVAMTQQEIDVAASVTNPMVAGGGILGFIIASSIDNSKNKNAEAAIASIRDLLIEYKMAGRFYELMESSDVAALLSTNSIMETSMEHGRDYSANPLKQAQFIIIPRVEFSNDMSTLWVVLNVSGQVPNEKGKPGDKSFYGLYKYLYPLEEPPAGDDRVDYVAVWSELGKSKLIDIIEQGMISTIDLLKLNAANGSIPVTDTVVKIPNAAGVVPKLNLISTNDGILWARNKNHESVMFAVPENLAKIK
ncbi:MAG: hypothetical protein Tsb0027_01270 [Wenzhouxiangellaceae bacterium]